MLSGWDPHSQRPTVTLATHSKQGRMVASTGSGEGNRTHIPSFSTAASASLGGSLTIPTETPSMTLISGRTSECHQAHRCRFCFHCVEFHVFRVKGLGFRGGFYALGVLLEGFNRSLRAM